jgi:hypothetical protein
MKSWNPLTCKLFRFEIGCLCSGLVALLGLACSDSADTDDPVSMSAAGSSGNSPPPSGPVQFATTGNDAAICQSATFCDDFEAAAANAAPGAPWVVTQTNGSVLIDETRAFRGSHAIKASTLATAMTGMTYKRALIGLSGAPVIPLPEQRVYGRMMFYLESAPATNVHWTIIDGFGTVPGQDYTATYRYGGQLPVMDGGVFKGSQLMANYDTTDYYATPSKGPQTDCYKHAEQKVVPVAKWSCAEWFFDGTNDQMRFWLDGAEVTEIEIDHTGSGCGGQPASYEWTAPAFTRLDVGWESYQTDEARTIWIDDVVISQSQVGCPERAVPMSNANPGGY